MSFLAKATLRAPLSSARYRRVTCRAASPDPPPPQSQLPQATASPANDNVGDKLSEWLQSPFDFAAFGPRLTVGGMLSLPERLGSLQAELAKLREIADSPEPVEDKTKRLLAEIEMTTTELLERGAYVEADIIRQIKASLPADISSQIEVPKTPSSTPPEDYEAATGPITTSTGPVVTDLPDDVDLN